MVKLDIRVVHKCHDCNYLMYNMVDTDYPTLFRYSCVKQGLDNSVVRTSELWKNCPLPPNIEEYVEYGELKK